MNGRAIGWGLALMAAGGLVAAGLVGSGWPTGPRIGAATLLLAFGFTVLLAGNAAWILRRTTNPEDYKGGCPVGAKCACGHFNFKPRATCKECGAATLFT